MEKLLRVEELKVEYLKNEKIFTILNGISFNLDKGKKLAIVGESGSGKTILGLSILRLIEPPLRIKEGKVFYNEKDILKLDEEELRQIRGKEISLVFQEPLSALNPVLTIGFQIKEAILAHKSLPKNEVLSKCEELLRIVYLPDPKRIMKSYPHEISGGMRQRVMIAMALAQNPKLLIADEPTTALDVTIQAQILNLIDELVGKFNLTLILISHDIGVVNYICDEVIVIYAGNILEKGKKNEILKNPLHPYTKGLLNSIPKKGEKRLKSIKGNVPPLSKLPSGCPFRDRCDFAFEKCEKFLPPLFELENDRRVRCFLFEENRK